MDAQADQVGLPILYQVLDSAGDPKDISAYTTKELIFKKPNGVRVVKTAVFNTNGVDGVLKWVTVAGDLSPYGAYQVNAHLVSATVDEYTEVAQFPVKANL